MREAVAAIVSVHGVLCFTYLDVFLDSSIGRLLSRSKVIASSQLGTLLLYNYDCFPKCEAVSIEIVENSSSVSLQSRHFSWIVVSKLTYFR